MSNFSPSRGGIGIKLNKNNEIFNEIKEFRNKFKFEFKLRLTTKAIKNAKIKFEIGPAKATKHSAVLREREFPKNFRFKNLELYGAGFPAANIGIGKINEIIKVIAGNMIVQKRSMCFNGFSVNLPFF